MADSAPEYLVCLECETPNYTFEWSGGKLQEVLCTACGADDPDLFATQDDLDALAMGGH
jgi:translation initiation factor 2 beta subunit (eIF-2beta)/eIF-5